MSIFSGLSPENLRIAAEAARRSPQALAAVAIVGVVAVLAIGFCAAFAARHIGGFYARVEAEDEQAAQEEAELAASQRKGIHEGETGEAAPPSMRGEDR